MGKPFQFESGIRLRFAFFSPPLSSHVAVHGALADALSRRGHECVLIHHPGVRPLIPTPNLRLVPLDAARCAWSPETVLRHARKPGLPFGVFRMVRDMAEMTRSLCDAAPLLLDGLGVDGIVCDQMESAGVLVAEHLGLPVVTVAAAAPINREPTVPLPVLDWAFEDSDKARKRNRAGERVADWLTARLDRTIADEAARLGCAPKARQSDCLSPLAEVCQFVSGFDFPRREAAPVFHYVGPIRAEPAVAGSGLPANRADRPFVFLSLGTMQGHRLPVFRKVAKACRALGAQLLAAHCGGLSEREAATVDTDWVVDRVSQEAAVARADVVVTHAGLNTVMDALQAGKPMLCLPLAFDQPGIAARVKRLGAGEVLSARASASRIETALAALLGDGRYRDRAASLRGAIASAGGAALAAAIVEEAARTRRPVMRLPQTVAA